MNRLMHLGLLSASTITLAQLYEQTGLERFFRYAGDVMNWREAE